MGLRDMWCPKDLEAKSTGVGEVLTDLACVFFFLLDELCKMVKDKGKRKPLLNLLPQSKKKNCSFDFQILWNKMCLLNL